TDAKKLRRRVLIDQAQGRAVAGGHARKRGGKLAPGGVCIHGWSIRAPGRHPYHWQSAVEISHIRARASSAMRGPRPDLSAGGQCGWSGGGAPPWRTGANDWLLKGGEIGCWITIEPCWTFRWQPLQ